MAIVISGSTGINMGNLPVSNASQVDSTIINENGDNVATTSNLVGMKNYLINGNFDHWQYKDAGLTYPQTSSGYGSDDRWANANSGSTKTHSQMACTDTERALFNASKFSRTVVTSVVGAGNIVNKFQAIEDVTKLAGKTVTLSFWAKADSNKNIAIELIQSFGTGGSPSAIVTGVSSQLVSLTTTWQKKIITVAIPSIVGKTIGTDGVHTSCTFINLFFDAGSNFNTRTANLGQQSGTFDIAQVQLEEGSVATPFEQRHPGLELSLCQRYYEFGSGTLFCTTSSASFAGAIDTKILREVKRTVPTFTIAKTAGSIASISIGASGSRGISVTPVSQASDGQYAYYDFTASAEL